MMKKTLFTIMVIFLVYIVNAQTLMGNEKLKVSINGRYLILENGQPYFWLGDTGWLLFTKLNREEVDQYLTDRATKGFNVIQVMVLHSLNATNAIPKKTDSFTSISGKSAGSIVNFGRKWFKI